MSSEIAVYVNHSPLRLGVKSKRHTWQGLQDVRRDPACHTALLLYL
jgi:hypothetical protein